MKAAFLSLFLLTLSLHGFSQTRTLATEQPRKFYQITLKKKGGGYSISVPVDQGFTVGGLSPNAFESRFNGMHSLPPLLEFMDQNGYRMTQAIPRRGWGLLFQPGTQHLLIFERK